MYEQTKEVYTKESKTVYTCRFCKVYSENKLGIFLHEQQCCHNPIYLKMLKDNGLEGHLITDSHGKQYLLKIDLKNRMNPFLVMTIYISDNKKQTLEIERVPEILVPYRDIIVKDEPIYFKNINGEICMNTVPERFKHKDADCSVTFDIYPIAPRRYDKESEEEHIDISNLELIGDNKIISPIPNKGMLNTYPMMDHHSPKLMLPLLIPERNTKAYFKKMKELSKSNDDGRCLLSMNTAHKYWLPEDDYINVRYDFYIDPDCPRHGCRHSIYYTNNA